MNRTITYPITESDAGLTVWEFLRLHGYSRHIISRLKRTPMGVLIRADTPTCPWCLSAGQLLTVQIIEEESSDSILPVRLPLSIVYEDEDLLIVDKPAGMPVHPALYQHDNTLANAVAWHYASRKEPFVFRCINRLDRDTTGLLILAKNLLSAAVLSADMKQRRIHRSYLALVKGTPAPPSGCIDAPIGRAPGSVLARRVDPNGEHARTHYQVLIDCAEHSLVRLNLDTGRTHQIRVHMTHIGHPLLGDFLYHPEDTTLSRQALHSWTLEFNHPISGKPLFFKSPLPTDMAQLLQP